MRKILVAFLIIGSVMASYGQTDTAAIRTNLSNGVDNPDNLLPQKMMVTQRMLWGQKGLMRKFKSFELTPENREREVDIRNTMITTHQYLGYATLAGLASECVVGIMLSNGKNVSGLHEGLAGATNLCYFTTAGLGLFAPPRLKDREAGWSKAKIHKTLSILHLTTMIATNVLAGMSESNPKLLNYHKAAAITTFGLYLSATVVIKL